MFASWANSNSVIKTSKKLAKNLNCPLTNSNKIKACMKLKSGEEISKTAAKMVILLNLY